MLSDPSPNAPYPCCPPLTALPRLATSNNAVCMKTTARFDKESQTFDLHTPSADGVKTWLVSGSRRCTHAVVFAQVPAADAIRVFVCQVSYYTLCQLLAFWQEDDQV